MRTTDAIAQELATEEAKLTELERWLSTTRARIDVLRAELQTASVAKPTAPSLSAPVARKAPANAADKVKLFRSLFRGRTDVFPIRFVSKKTGNPGYAPACSNKWKPGLSHLKSRGKCSDCPNQRRSHFDPERSDPCDTVARHRYLCRTTWHRQDGTRHPPDRSTGTQHPDPGAPQAIARSMDRTTRHVPRHR